MSRLYGSKNPAHNQDLMQSPGFEPGPRTWQARIITKLYYDCLSFMREMLYNCF